MIKNKVHNIFIYENLKYFLESLQVVYDLDSELYDLMDKK